MGVWRRHCLWPQASGSRASPHLARRCLSRNQRLGSSVGDVRGVGRSAAVGVDPYTLFGACRAGLLLTVPAGGNGAQHILVSIR